MQDLLSIGEAFAELDLVVRQQDDGSLTLSDDDAIPDPDRVRVVAGEVGLEGSLRLAKAQALTPELGRALDQLNAEPGPVRFVWRVERVFAQVALPWGDRSFARNQLHVFYGALAEAQLAYGGALAAAIGGQSSWTSLHDSGELLPPSYLAGAGQGSAEEGLTKRYGSSSDVPGRSETSSTARHPAPARSGGGVGMALLGLLALAGVGAGVFAVVSERGEPAETLPSPPASAVAAVDDPDPDPDPDTGTGTDTDAGTDAGTDTGTDTGTGTGTGAGAGTPATPRPTPVGRLDEDAVLRAVRAEPDRRPELVRHWSRQGFDRGEGARRRMLEALGGDGDYDPDVGRLLLQSMRDRPLDPDEAMDCFDLTRAGLRRELLQTLSGAKGDVARDVAGFLAERRGEDTEDLLIEAAILELGYGDAQSFLRVAQARGIEWVTFGRGKALLERMASRDLMALHPILQSGEEALRVLVLGVMKGVEGQDATALRLYVSCLDDPAPSVRQHAVQGCVGLGDPKVAWALARALVRETDDQTLDALRDAFLRLPSDATVSLLERLYRKPDPQERIAAVRGLEATQTTGGVTALIAALEDPDLGVRRAALEGLETHHKRNPDLRPTVAEGLGAIRRLALTSQDAELTRLAKNLHYRIAGKMPR